MGSWVTLLGANRTNHGTWSHLLVRKGFRITVTSQTLLSSHAVGLRCGRRDCKRSTEYPVRVLYASINHCGCRK